jgi:mannose-6-phosphate isomerase-like protein (cupin superfamily)
VPTGDVFENPAARMTLQVVRGADDTGGELLELEATYEPGSVEPPEHLHPKQDERFEILAGTMAARIGDERKLLEAGEELFIPAGTPHSMWNAGSDTARLAWETRPALRTEDFFRAVARVAEAAMSGEPLPDDAPSGEALLREFRDEFRLA